MCAWERNSKQNFQITYFQQDPGRTWGWGMGTIYDVVKSQGHGQL